MAREGFAASMLVEPGLVSGREELALESATDEVLSSRVAREDERAFPGLYDRSGGVKETLTENARVWYSSATCRNPRSASWYG